MSLLHASLHSAKEPIAVASADPTMLPTAEDLADRLLEPNSPEALSVRRHGYIAFAKRGGDYRAVVLCEPEASSSRAMQLMLEEMLSRAPALASQSRDAASAMLADLAVKYVGSAIALTLARVEAMSLTLGAVKAEAVQTIAGLLERGERLEGLASGAEALETKASDFRKGAARAQRQQQRESWRPLAIYTAIGVVSMFVVWRAVYA